MRKWLHPLTTVREGQRPDATRFELSARDMLGANMCHLGPPNKLHHVLEDTEPWSLGLWMPPGKTAIALHFVFYLKFLKVIFIYC